MDLRSAEARARDQWLDSHDGRSCQSGSAEGQYLRNRLELAFLAGVAAGRAIQADEVCRRAADAIGRFIRGAG